MKVHLEYFSLSGKWKYKGEYQSNHKEMWRVFDEVQEMKKNNKLPGITSGSWDGFIYINSPSGYPRLIKP